MEAEKKRMYTRYYTYMCVYIRRNCRGGKKKKKFCKEWEVYIESGKRRLEEGERKQQRTGRLRTAHNFNGGKVSELHAI